MKDLIKFVLLVALIVIPIRVYIAQPFIVNGASMDPTFHHGEYLIVDQLTYRFNDPERGEVVVFRYPQDPSQFFIKRVIGLPGERLVLNNSSITIYSDEYPDGLVLDEPYVAHTRNNDTSITLEIDEYFVLGDNRAASSDSRSWGPLPEDLVIGRPIVRMIPFNAITTFPGSYKDEYAPPPR